MSTYVLRDCKLYVGAFDFSADGNSIAVNPSIDLAPFMGFGQEWVRRLSGERDCQVEYSGYVNLGAGGVEAASFSITDGGMNTNPLTVSPVDGAVGDQAYIARVVVGAYSPGGAHGEIYRFSLSMSLGASSLIQGEVMATGEKTVSGNGAASQLGDVASGKVVRGALHVLTASGSAPTLSVVVESDDNAGMTSPTARLTFATKTATGSEMLEATGSITDEWWRAVWTIGGSAPSFKFVVALGIGTS
jgi:hypothetical protein